MGNKTCIKVYHGTDSEFDTFSGVVHFSESPEFAARWGETVKKATITLSNPYVIENEGMHHEFLDDPVEIAKLKKRGYDGVVIKNKNLPTNYVVFYEDEGAGHE